MPRDRRDLISDLYHSALARAPEERGAFLTEACKEDEGLRQEVESLLEYESASVRFLERPAADVAVAATGSITMIDRRIGPYTIMAPLGAGGMGEVYRARDSQLGREVAIKILPSHFTADPERRARFAREARTLATLNHPHIGAIYGLEESDGLTALVLELVEGPTLADRLGRGPLPVADTLAIASQIAAALDAAHGKGIVHRDLKPANIVLTGEPAGDLRAKVLDFGLAKAMVRDEAAASPKETSGSFDGTADGRVLGTPAYMSPEQARGQTVDNRTDVWAFGCVLYEMLTGRPPFEGKTMSDTFVSILEREPDWAALPVATPESIRRLLERCLRKDPRKRLHDIADAILDIDDATTVVPGMTRPPASALSGLPRRSAVFFGAKAGRAVVPWLVASVLAATLVWVGLLYYRAARTHPTEAVQLTIHLPEGVVFPAAPEFALSPDGRYLAFAQQLGRNRMLWVHSLVTGETKALPLTEGAPNGPFWKPDSQAIGYFDSANRQLKIVALSGGSPVVVADAALPLTIVQASRRGFGFTGTWHESGAILVSLGPRGIQKVKATGGALEAATVLASGDVAHGAPSFLPDGVHFLYMARIAATQQLELRAGSLDSKEFVESLGPVESNALYAGGYLFSVRGGHMGGGNLTVQAFDPHRRRPIGAPVALGLPAALHPLVQYAAVSVSADSNRLVYSRRGSPVFDLTWRNRDGERVGTVGEAGVYSHVDLSPDDSSLAVARQTQEAGKPFQIDIWTITPGGIARRITDDPAFDVDPAWSGDGRQLVFNSNRPERLSRSFGLFVRPSNAAGEDTPIAKPTARLIESPDWSLDNRHIVYVDDDDLWTVPMTGDRKPTVFLKTKFRERQPVFSTDVRWVAYASNSSGREEVYIRPFPRGETAHPVSRGGGFAPRWRRDGKELFFIGSDGWMMAVSIDPTKGTATGVPQRLFATDFRPENNRPYDVTRDGERFLVPTIRPSDDLRVVLNWRLLVPR